METIDYSTSYNIAVKYLKDKYGYTNGSFTRKFADKLIKARNKKEYKKILDSVTIDDYQTINMPVTDDNDKEIELLLSQYPYGWNVRKELYNKLCILGLIK